MTYHYTLIVWLMTTPWLYDSWLIEHDDMTYNYNMTVWLMTIKHDCPADVARIYRSHDYRTRLCDSSLYTDCMTHDYNMTVWLMTYRTRLSSWRFENSHLKFSGCRSWVISAINSPNHPEDWYVCVWECVCVCVCVYVWCNISLFLSHSTFYIFIYARIWTHTHTHTCTISTHKEEWQQPSTGIWLEGQVEAISLFKVKTWHIYIHT